MAQPLISILIPFKDTSRFVGQCIETILNQTYPHWELIIVNDHSIDNSYQNVLAYAENDMRITLLENKGKGIIAALRLAFSKSNGEYITRMDSDDKMHLQKLEFMLKDLQRFGKGHVALGLVEYFSDNGVGKGYKAYQDWLNKLTETGTNFSQIYKECVIPSPCWMMHRSDLERCGAFQLDTYPEDYDLTFRCYEKGIICIPSKHMLHFWRDHRNRASRTDGKYAENSFLELKVSYFLKLNYKKSRPLVIWGAGQKGKKIARLLASKNVAYNWVCDNPKKIGKHIYNVKLEHFKIIGDLRSPQVIIAVANPGEQKAILRVLKTLNMTNMKDYFFFC